MIEITLIEMNTNTIMGLNNFMTIGIPPYFS
mgnify:CR=1 FL=1